jgi:dCMP deaminase
MTDQELLDLLLATAQRSDCAKLKFGAAAIDAEGTVRVTGYNHHPHPPAGYTCAERCAGGIRKGVKSGTCVERCYAIHAEQHALLRGGLGVVEIAVAGLLPDGSLFDNGGGFYCTVCARLMLTAGVQRVSIWSNGERKVLSIHEAWDQSYSIGAA